jgi:hypothetical protein
MASVLIEFLRGPLAGYPWRLAAGMDGQQQSDWDGTRI